MISAEETYIFFLRVFGGFGFLIIFFFPSFSLIGYCGIKGLGQKYVSELLATDFVQLLLS